MNSLFTPNLDIDNLPIEDINIKRYLNRFDVAWGIHEAKFNDETHLMSFLYNISRAVSVGINIQDMNQQIDFMHIKHSLTYDINKETQETDSPQRKRNPRRKLGKSDKNRIRDARSRRKAKKKAKATGISA